MATQDRINEFMQLSEEIHGIDRDRLLRKSLGTVSLQQDFEPKLEEILRRTRFAMDYVAEVPDNCINRIISGFRNILNEINAQIGRPDEEYVAQRVSFLTNVQSYLEDLKLHWAPIMIEAIESRGLLDDKGIQLEYEKSIEALKTTSENTLQQLRTEAQKTISDAEELAKQIEDRARFTASGISVREAQKQFSEAQTRIDRRVNTWALIGSICIALFIGAICLFWSTDLPDQWRWEVIYHSVIRISLLAALGTITAFSLRIFRAHLHMSEKNQHRQRIANSMAAFVESASTPEQRDQILGQLVESIVQFGNSGLLQQEDENTYRPKMTIDSIIRSLSTGSGKQQG